MKVQSHCAVGCGKEKLSDIDYKIWTSYSWITLQLQRLWDVYFGKILSKLWRLNRSLMKLVIHRKGEKSNPKWQPIHIICTVLIDAIRRRGKQRASESSRYVLTPNDWLVNDIYRSFFFNFKLKSLIV